LTPKIIRKLFSSSAFAVPTFTKFFNYGFTAQPIAIAGPSGSGKSTLISKLMKEYPHQFVFSISHTTRSPRAGEVDGVNYYFTDRETMQKAILNGQFIETAEFAGHLYGTSRSAIQAVKDSGKICLLDIDIQGILSLKKTDLNPRYVFLSPPSLEILERRLRNRRDTEEHQILRRLQQAKLEMEYRDQPGFFDLVIINDNLERAYQEFKEFCTRDVSGLNRLHF